MKVDGSCHCGKITYTAEVDPDTVGICHCTDCQQLSGSPYRASIAAPAASFVLHGEPTHYIKVADSGRRRVQAFCPECGSHLYATSSENPVTYNLRLGSIRQRDQLKVRRQIWCDSALPWAQNISSIPAAARE